MLGKTRPVSSSDHELTFRPERKTRLNLMCVIQYTFPAMQENVKVVPSFATSFTMYATPDVTVNPVGTGKISVHED